MSHSQGSGTASWGFERWYKRASGVGNLVKIGGCGQGPQVQGEAYLPVLKRITHYPSLLVPEYEVAQLPEHC